MKDEGEVNVCLRKEVVAMRGGVVQVYKAVTS